MSETKIKANFLLNEEVFIIKNLILKNEDTIDFLKDIAKEDYERVITKAIDIGIRVISEQKPFEKVDYVKGEFQKFTFEIQRQMNEIEESFERIFGEEGILTEFSDKEYGIPAKVREGVMDEKIGLKAYLNPNNENSPLYQLKRDLSEQITDLRDKIIGDIASKEAYGKTSLKGKDFEIELLNMLRGLTKYYGDIIEPVGEVITDSKRKVGDLLIGIRDPLLGEEELLMVVEAKDRTYVNVEGKGGLLHELTEGIINRKADFGVAIMKNRAGLPDYVGHFRFYEPNMIVTCCDEPIAIELAYRFGRSIALTRYLSQSYKRVDWENVQKFAKFLENSLKKITTAKSDIGNIEKGLKGIKKMLMEYNEEIEEALSKLYKNLEMKEGE